MESETGQPDDIIVQQQNADAAQHATYAMLAPDAPRCYYCGESVLRGSIFCERCSDWMEDRLYRKARIGFWLGLLAILTMLVGIAAFSCMFLNTFMADLHLDQTSKTALTWILMGSIYVTIALGAISIVMSRESKRQTGGFYHASGEHEQLQMLGASKAGEFMGTISVAIVVAIITGIALFAVLFFVGLYITGGW